MSSILKFAVMALVGAVAAVGTAEAVTSFGPTARPVAPEAAATPIAMVAAEPASIVKASDGHYWAEALVNGKSVRFLVDTGATAVALTLADAQRLGFTPKDLTYGYSVMTASGKARAAAVKLASVSVAGARVADVDALVIEKGLETSLLGMTYLGRLSRFEATRSSLILRP